MFETIKLYIMAAIAVVVAAFAAMFAYRGQRIDTLETELGVAETKAAVTAKVVEADREVADFEATNKVERAKAEARDYDEINDNFYSI